MTFEQLMPEVADAFGKGVRFVFDNPEFVTLEATLVAILITVLLVRRFYPPKAKARGEVDEMKRRVQLESLYSDKIHDFMLDLYSKGEINRKEYKRDCKRFGIAFRLFDLLRSPRRQIGIKHRVLRNIALNHATLPFSQVNKNPGPKPGEDLPTLPVVPKPRKVWVVVGKRRTSA